ncbi:MAG TPA: NAD-dependent DNA ligase LigA [Cyclobacteriaceae bacterium]|nr:NAD-dependent DNA ligase LigA [Cyclobacteriaceae bacterium]
MNPISKDEAKTRIAELTDKINYHNHLYYQEDKSEISDFEFDQLMEELMQLEQQFPEFLLEDSPSQRVGGTITKEFESSQHGYRMLSLGNTYSESELVAFDDRVAKILDHRIYTYFCELKFDGVAISLVYEQGKLVRAVTRGDGVRGDNVTENVKTIRNIPLSIKGKNIPEKFEVRGEIFLPKKEFLKINEERKAKGEPLLANPRNAASGTIKMQDSGIVAKRRLNCYFYQLLGEDVGVGHHNEAISLLEKWGFNVSPTYRNCTDIQSVFNYIQYWREKRFELPLDTDGVVLKINDYDQREELGFTAKIPRWAIAYKYQAESTESQLLSVTYQVGRTGAITPVANLSPVSLAGTTVKRASLHNANEIERLGLHVGDTVAVEKGGEIIPKITRVIMEQRIPGSEPIPYITQCPECGTELERKPGEAKHFCPNIKTCPPQILGRIEHFVSKRAMDIDSLGTERIRALIDHGYLINPADIYDLVEKKEALLGLEINPEQYLKDGEGHLYISLRKVLYGLTDQIPLTLVDQFLLDYEDVDLRGKLSLFIDTIKLNKKKVEQNTQIIQILMAFLDREEFDEIEDFVPVAIVLSLMTNKEAVDEEYEQLSLRYPTLHDIYLASSRDYSSDFLKKLKKLKGNTFQEGVISNMVDGIEASRNQAFEKVLFGLGIRNIGENTAKLLVSHFINIENLKNASAEELLQINGVGETLVLSLQDFFSSEENLEVIRRLKAHGLRFESDQKPPDLIGDKLANLKILASGKFNHFKRDEIIDFIESQGGTYVKSVSKALDFIVEGEEMGPSKKEKAQKLNIKLISEEEFLKMVGLSSQG